VVWKEVSFAVIVNVLNPPSLGKPSSQLTGSFGLCPQTSCSVYICRLYFARPRHTKLTSSRCLLY